MGVAVTALSIHPVSKDVIVSAGVASQGGRTHNQVSTAGRGGPLRALLQNIVSLSVCAYNSQLVRPLHSTHHLFGRSGTLAT